MKTKKILKILKLKGGKYSNKTKILLIKISKKLKQK